MGIGKMTGCFFSVSRDALAKGLIRVGVTPNVLTVFGLIFTAGAGVALAAAVELTGGRGCDFQWWSRAHGYYGIAAGLLFLSNACDMLDGAAARIGNMSSKFGGFLDSSLDRLNDFFMWAGPAAGYTLLEKPNITFVLLCMVAVLNSFMISYCKCRAEDFIDQCRVGFWRRGERCAAVLIAAIACNISMAVVMIALSGTFTWLRRISYTRTMIRQGRQQDTLLGKIQPWRWPRMTLPHDAAVIGNISMLMFLRFDPADLDLLRNFM